MKNVARSLEPRVFIVGRVAVESDGRVVDETQFPGRQGRLTFAYLVAEQGRAVPRDELADALWGDAPPSSWDKALTGIVSKLRNLLADQGIDGANALTGAFGCYRLELPEGTWVDVLAAATAVDDAEVALKAGELDRARADAALAVSVLGQPFLPGEDGSWVDEKRRELADLRARGLSVLAEASLRSGDAPEAVKWAEQTVALAPFRETGYRRLMEAHVAGGDRAEALRVYERCRRLLAHELGTYPSPETESLYRALLEAPHLDDRAAPTFERPPESAASAMVVCAACGGENSEGARFCNERAAPLAVAHTTEQRKTVTVVFCDVVGSTALGGSNDPEALKRLLERYFDRMKLIVERHGGTVEKFIGDAGVAVFGVPVVHEDDALRALRAAVEMRDALPELQVEARLGVNTGEIVTGGHGKLVTGDAVNVAARLQQAASPSEILVGAETVALFRTAVEVEQLDPLELKGKTEPVAAFRLLGVGEAPGRSHGSRFVGRGAELDLLRAAWGRVVERQRCELVTIVGEPGVGKSRLVGEFTAGLEVPVVQGRCLSYGEGITYYPVVQVIRQLGELPDDQAIASALGPLLGVSDAPTSPAEIASAFRRLLEFSAPRFVVFDDIQWGEETFLDLVEEVALLSTGAPILVCCLTRPELTARRPEWPVTVRLQPLQPDAVEELMPVSVPPGLREQITRAAGGNPLFVTEMVAMASEAGEVVVPASLRALLAARLDQLEAAERGVLERGSIEGELFHRGAVQSLEPDGVEVATSLRALVRRELIRPDRGLLPGEDAFRFCHLLIRDAAYEALPKANRAELHERFAGWLERHGADLVEQDELVGYHLQQASLYLHELGAPASEFSPLAERAASFLASAGRRAAVRGDYRAVASLAKRALELGLPNPRERLQLEVELGIAFLRATTVPASRRRPSR